MIVVMMMSRKGIVALASVCLLVGVACFGRQQQKQQQQSTHETTLSHTPPHPLRTTTTNTRSLWSFWGSSSSSSSNTDTTYDGAGKNGEYCYNVNIGNGQLCCDESYNTYKNGFPKSSICYLGEMDYSCQDLHEAVFVVDGDITMPKDMIGKRAFPTIVSKDGFKIQGTPSLGKTNEAPFDYRIQNGPQNGLETKLTGKAFPIPEKFFLVSGWNEKKEPSDHEIEWAGPSAVGLGGESFDTPAVLMKGSGASLIYLDDQDGILHGAGFKTPIDPADNVNYEIKEVEFCFTYQPAPPKSNFRDGGDEGEGGGENPTENRPAASMNNTDDSAKQANNKDSGITGDPHIKRWDGVTYDFQGACDLVMLQNPDFNNGQGLHIHIRTKIEHWWSFIESAAVKIGDDTLEVHGGAQERRYWVNGKEGNRFRASRNLPFTIGGFHGRFRAINKVLTQYKIFLPNDQVIAIKSTKDMLRVDLLGSTEEDFGNSFGLMGAYGSGVMVGRDNETVFSDPNEFGQEWQVKHEPMLFHDVQGPQFPEQCAIPHSEPVGMQRRMLVASIDREAAERACARVKYADEVESCVSDVLATGDIDLAAAYL